MSYILDALRRADSERERERIAVPGLHTQAVPLGAPEGDGEARPSAWKWPIVAGFVALLALVAWLWFGRTEAPQPPPALAAPAPLPAAPTATATTTAPPMVAATPPPQAATGAAPPQEPAPAPARKPPAPAAKKNPVAAAPQAAATKPVAKASDPEPKISTLNELPDEVRRELPPITVSGSIYSKSAANRMLVINGQVFHEGDELAAGLVLEQIRQKSAVLKVKGYRYEITY